MPEYDERNVTIGRLKLDQGDLSFNIECASGYCLDPQFQGGPDYGLVIIDKDTKEIR